MKLPKDKKLDLNQPARTFRPMPSITEEPRDIQEFAEFIIREWLHEPISVKMVKSLYGFVEEKVRNQLVRELKEKGTCSICGCSKNSFYE